MGHNFGMYHDDDCKSANNINREVYPSGCSCFNAFLNPNCRIVITLPNFTFQALLTCPHLIQKSIFHCLLFRPFAFWWRANLHRERDAWERRSLFHASMLHFCFVLLCIWGRFPSTSPTPLPGRLYLEGRFNGGFFALRVWGACTWRGFFQNCMVYWYKDCYFIFFPFERGILANGLKVKLFYISVPDCKCNAADHQGCIMSAVARQVFCLLPVANSRSLKITVVSLSYKNMFDIRWQMVASAFVC